VSAASAVAPGIDGFVEFPGALCTTFPAQLGAAEYLEHIGPLLQASTLVNYGPKVRKWFEYNQCGGYDPHLVTNAKVCAFAGWLGWGQGVRSSRDKTFNGFTSALNGYFDAKFQTRPFNSHYIKQLKSKYHDAQLCRTMAALPEGALEPAEARIGLPPSGIGSLWWQVHRATGVPLFRTVLLCDMVVSIVRPATVWALEPGDIDVIGTPDGRLYIVMISRSVKRHPEYLLCPDRREIEVPLVEGHPLLVLAYAIFRARRLDSAWCTQLRREVPLQRNAAARVSAWLRAAVPPTQLALPAGRRISAYSLKIAGVSAMRIALNVEPDFVRRWGLWSAGPGGLRMVEKYTDVTYGRSELLGQLFGWARSRQFECTVTLPDGATADKAAIGLLAAAQRRDTTALRDLEPATSTRHLVILPPRDFSVSMEALRRQRARRLARR
jgi:hypothetical protein